MARSCIGCCDMGNKLKKVKSRRNNKKARDSVNTLKSCSTCGKHVHTSTEVAQKLHSSSNRQLPHKCNVCGKGFLHKCRMMKHSQTHESKLRLRYIFKCDCCDKSYTNKQNLLRHKRNANHQGTRDDLNTLNKYPFVCVTCQLKFARKEYLKVHRLIHKKKFSLKRVDDVRDERLFEQDESTHQQETPVVDLKFSSFDCDKCEKKFVRQAYLTKHIKAVHGTCELMNREDMSTDVQEDDSFTLEISTDDVGEELPHENRKSRSFTSCNIL